MIGGSPISLHAGLFGAERDILQGTIPPGLIETYNAWLAFERRYLVEQIFPGQPTMVNLVPLRNAGARFHFDRPDALSRAAVVLKAVGCHWAV